MSSDAKEGVSAKNPTRKWILIAAGIVLVFASGETYKNARAEKESQVAAIVAEMKAREVIIPEYVDIDVPERGESAIRVEVPKGYVATWQWLPDLCVQGNGAGDYVCAKNLGPGENAWLGDPVQLLDFSSENERFTMRVRFTKVIGT